VADALAVLAGQHVDAGRAGDAVPIVERALATYARAQGVAPADLARARFVAARAVWATGGDRGRALDLARQASAAYAASGPTVARARTRTRGWRRGADPTSALK
jgi:hypothetical protein